jgi:type I restriction enzyme, S subunit
MNLHACRLGDVLTLKRGHDLPEQSRQSGEVPVVSSSGVTGYHNEAKAVAPGVVTGRYGTLGEVFYVEEDYWPLNTALYVIDFKGNDPRFIAYFLKNVLRGYRSDKAAVPGIDRNALHELMVRVPGENEQVAIAATLSAYDDLIANNRRRIELLEQSARLFFKEWFVHLRYPGHEHEKIIDGVPLGWRIELFGDVVLNFDSKRVPLSVMQREQRPGKYPYYGAAAVLDHIDGFLFDGRYLLVGEDGTVMTPSGTPMLQLVQGQFWVNNHAHVIKGNKVTTEYVYCFLSGYQITGHVTGVAQPKVTQASLNRIKMRVPSATLSDTFQKSVAPIFDQIFILKSAIRNLERARDLLLPRLLDGRLSV